jgi:hypothetical protein
MSHRGAINACTRTTALAAALTLAIVSLCILAASASAAIGGELTRFGGLGSGPGEFGAGAQGAGMDADPNSGHLFIADQGNKRIDEFTAWGEFVKAWGYGVADDSSSELQTCTSTCFAGDPGSGAGQLNQPNGVAVGPNGDVYVFERVNRRVQVFSPAGDFLFMFGGGVNHTTGADICTKADLEGGDVCGAGTNGTGPSEFSLAENGLLSAGDYIDIGLNGVVYVADNGRIQEFELDGSFKGELSYAAIAADEPAFPASREPGALSVDPESGDLYLVFRFQSGESPVNATLWRLTSTGEVVPPAPLLSASAEPLDERAPPEAVTTDNDGNVYAAVEQFQKPPDEANLLGEQKVLQLNDAGQWLDSCCSSPGRSVYALATNVVTAAGGVDLYVLHYREGNVYVEVRGPAPDKWPPPVVPPEIAGQFAEGVEDDSAILKAEINPNFWPDTHFYLEYGSSPCAEGGCQTTPTPPGELLGAGAVKRPEITTGIAISNLSPGTTYHYRFVVTSGGGGPVYGPDGTFTTFPASSGPTAPCPNDPFRTGAAARLADCRAYEMVSPVDKLGGDILVQLNQLGFPARLDQAAESGDRVTYSSYRAFGGSESAGYASQFLAARTGTGWSTQAISAPREGGPVYGGLSLDAPYKAFLEDLSAGWLRQETEPVLAAGGVPGFANLYRRDLPTGGFSAVTTSAPTNQTASSYFPEVQGFSSDGRRVVFAANGKLTSNASGNDIWQVYESFEGTVRLVSVRPNGSASNIDAYAGSSTAEQGARGEGRGANVATAVSADGSKIYWSEEADGRGKVYVRVNRTKTVAVSAGAATFWAATPSGSQAIYTEAGNLKLFDLESAQSTILASTVHGVLGAGDDLNRVYFVATGALAAGAKSGQPNLYLYEAGQPIAFIATLSSKDLGEVRGSLGVDLLAPWRRVARVSEDGGTAVFMSRTSLSGADTKDAASGEADAEVYRYSASSHSLLCLSCNPTGARSTGREFVLNKAPTGYWYASSIPGWEFQLHAARVIAADGARIFFNSFNRLVPADTNGAQDVYEWEAAGSGTCSEGSADYSSKAGGCVSLISSGDDPGDSEFIDAGQDGRDAFFVTGDSLVSQDPGQVDLYDAREGGGFASPTAPEECDGEECQQPAPPPSAPPWASEDSSTGNPKPQPHCKRGFVRRHGKCVRKHKRQHHKKHHRKHTGKKVGGR